MAFSPLLFIKFKFEFEKSAVRNLCTWRGDKKDTERNLTSANWVFAQTTGRSSSDRNTILRGRSLLEVDFSFKFHQNRSSGFGEVGGRNLPSPIALTMAYTTASTRIQAVATCNSWLHGSIIIYAPVCLKSESVAAAAATTTQWNHQHPTVDVIDSKHSASVTAHANVHRSKVNATYASLHQTTGYRSNNDGMEYTLYPEKVASIFLPLTLPNTDQFLKFTDRFAVNL